MNRASVEIVVARYKEDVSWLAETDYPAIIYDKGGDLVAVGGKCLKSLPNIGREGHTYFTHIIENYPVFPDYTIFLQGDPFFHTEKITAHEVFEQAAQKIAKNAKFFGFAWFKLRCDRLGRPHDMDDPKSKGKWKGWGKDIPVGEVFEKLFKRPSPEQFIASAPTGNFLVARERILTRPKSFYENALELILADPDDENNTGHAFERLWQVIFNGSTHINPPE
ncbi:DUF3431 domain-containing protein [Desulfovibrio sp. JC010]|uniref:DUF3431 domain-containing protein n=1 Tax=Desulfovibrio sp. JC010 TaxID=2593641 RepID=UPI0013D5B95D|nr:DUF3431 domain-containing protein [Desulfovibrio sp. JC010]NDV28109.1 DUF3431 domain-containing protein [Desulfovibrio sp. JC010]